MPEGDRGSCRAHAPDRKAVAFIGAYHTRPILALRTSGLRSFGQLLSALFHEQLVANYCPVKGQWRNCTEGKVRATDVDKREIRATEEDRPRRFDERTKKY